MSFESPVSVLYNENGYELALSSSQSINASTQPGIMIMGSASNGTAQFFKILSNGELLVGLSGTTNAVSVSNQPTVNQGNSGSIAQSWYVRLTDGTQVLGTGSSAPLWITGSVAANFVTVATQSVSIENWLPAVTASVREIGASTSTVSATIAANGLVGYVLLGANSNRKGAVFYLEGNRIALLKLGPGANTNSFSVRLTNNAYWELPNWYTGIVTCTFVSGTAAARLYATEYTIP